MKCPKCSTKKPMGNAQALVDGKLVPTWLCSPCGANILKVFIIVGYPLFLHLITKKYGKGKRMKLIKISICNKCPYCDDEMPDVFVEGGTYCEHPSLDDVKRVGSFSDEKIKIPKWCPLEDSK